MGPKREYSMPPEGRHSQKQEIGGKIFPIENNSQFSYDWHLKPEDSAYVYFSDGTPIMKKISIADGKIYYASGHDGRVTTYEEVPDNWPNGASQVVEKIAQKVLSAYRDNAGRAAS
jgi:hypothetical protein